MGERSMRMAEDANNKFDELLDSIVRRPESSQTRAVLSIHNSEMFALSGTADFSR